MKRKVVTLALLIVVLSAAETISARTLTGHDLIEAAVGRDLWVMFLALVALSTRLFLVLVVPGWVLYLVLWRAIGAIITARRGGDGNATPG